MTIKIGERIHIMSLFLNVPYAEKDEVKALGAKWNAKVKKWYIETYRDKYTKFAKWILRDTDEVFIAFEYIYIIEGEQKCWKCHKKTKVIGLGISEYINIYGELDRPQFYDSFESGDDNELHLAWVDKEEDIPPKLLKYLKEKYSVKTGYSNTLEARCFANHCDCCGALQGNYFLFDESTSPLSADREGKRLINSMSKLKIYGIPIDNDLQLNWNLSFSENDYAYFKYSQFEELVLSTNPENEYISYEELYEL